MDYALIEQNLLVRDTTPHTLRICEVWGHGDFLHICFSSVGCRFRKAGYCTMCDYGGNRNITADEAVSGFKKALEDAPGTVREVLLGTCGSILDKQEMDPQVLAALLEAVSESAIPSVILETHYTTVTQAALKHIKEALPGRELVIELGFESANPDILEHSLCKFMDLDALSNIIRQINDCGISPVLNVFLGAPFLTPEEQIQDAEKSIAWAVAHGASRVVVFPANIKPNTLLWKLHQEGTYDRISHWMLIELLSRLDDALLEKVELSWYGDRQNAGRDMHILPPTSCPRCQSILMSFYRAFMENFDPKRRRLLLEQLDAKVSCNCRSKFLASLGGEKRENR